MNSYKESSICEVCGKNKGGRANKVDHSQCAKIRQEAHKNDKRKKRPLRTIKSLIELGDFYNK